MQVFGRILTLLVGVLKCIFRFQFQSECSANLCHISYCLWSIGFGVFETAEL